MLKKLPVLHRTFEVNESLHVREDGGEQKTYEFSVSSETPVERWFGLEILSHEDGAIDKRYLKSGLAVIADSHYGAQVGIMEAGRLDSRKLKGDVRFSRGTYGREVEQDVQDKIRKYVSVGYRVLKAKLVEQKDGIDTWLVTRWMPIHVAILADPADVSVGAGRAEDREEFEIEIETDGDPVQEGRTMTRIPGTGAPETATHPAEGTVEVRTATPSAPLIQERDFSAEAADIFQMADEHGMTARAAEWVKKKMAPAQVAQEILSAKRTNGTAQPPAEELPGTETDLASYSYQRAMLQAIEHGENGKFVGLEGEVHQELKRKLPGGIKYRGGILVPMRTQHRTLDSKTATKGLELVQDRPGELIEILRNAAMVLRAGARLLTGLEGPVQFPKQTGASTVFWVPENPGTDVTDSDLLFGQVNLAPKTLQGNVPVSRQLLVQASLDVENMIREDLGAGHGLAVDQGAIHGSGVSGQPTGIYIAPDVQSTAMGGNPTFGKLVDMQGQVADKNASLGALSYMTTPLASAKMKQTLVASAAGADMIWTGTFADGQVAGYTARATNQVKKTLGAGANEHGLIFGNWNEVIIGLWNAMELIVDPYSKKKQGLIEVTSFQMADVVLRHGESFSKATGMVIS